ncbi:MAG TPA: hypothetical protein DD723_01455 [Candidatus Omnitrophica bacterium]|nr:MAG: hypothetical protein A2Z81_01965 [Omnitrophica WOR_2 bacterium GWA2_45_18]HBR14198.1 hypothetical protein [Candidatus Omnitrophota bacterium]
MKTNNLLAVPNDVARFLGSTIRRVENDVRRLFPFPKCVAGRSSQKPPVTQKESYAQALATKPLPPVGRTEASPVTPEKITPAPILEKKTVSQVFGLKGVEFENKAEQVRAEVYFRDLQSSSRTIRMEALREIKKLSRPTVVAVLEQMLSIEHDTLQIIEILNALAGIGDETLISKDIFKDYAGRQESGIRLAALRAISKYRDEESFNILTSYMKDKDAEVRRQMQNCLCWTFGERCLPFALNALHDADASVRKAASQIVGALKSHQAISGLITLLSDPKNDVQGSAAASLKKITGEDFNFKVTATKKNKEDAIESWRFWWRENQTEFERSKSQHFGS